MAEVFNTVQFDFELESFLGEPVEVEKITNADRSPVQEAIEEE